MPRLLNTVGFDTATTGTGSLAVTGAMTDLHTPAEAGISNGDRVPYAIKDTNGDRAWGIGVYSTSGPVLARDDNEVRIVSGVRSTAKLNIVGGAEVYIDAGEGVLATRPDVYQVTNLSALSDTLTPNINNYSVFRITAADDDFQVAAPVGTPYDGQVIRFEFQDNGTERAITWDNDAYGTNFAIPSPSTGDTNFYSVASAFVWNAARAKWICIYADVEPVRTNIQYVGGGALMPDGGTSASVSLTSLTGGIGTTALEDDVVIAAINKTASGTFSVAMSTSGYTTIDNQASGTAITFSNMGLFYKVMGSTPDTAAATTKTSSFAEGLAVMVFRGVDTSNVLDVAKVEAVGSGNSCDPAAITPVTQGSMIVVAGGQGESGTITPFSAPSDLTYFVEESEQESNSAGNIGMGAVLWDGLGAFDPEAWVGDTGGDSWSSYTIALRPRALN